MMAHGGVWGISSHAFSPQTLKKIKVRRAAVAVIAAVATSEGLKKRKICFF
jgi:hypothetical protein